MFKNPMGIVRIPSHSAFQTVAAREVPADRRRRSAEQRAAIQRYQAQLRAVIDFAGRTTVPPIKRPRR